jgi:hypothetical protein
MSDRSWKFINRRKVLQGIGTTAVISSASTAVQARDTYPQVNHENVNESIGDLLIDSAANPRIAEDPKHNRIAFVTNAFEQGLELYLADGVKSIDETASEIFQITSGSAVGTMDLTWDNRNQLEYWNDGKMYQLKLPPSNKIFEPNQIGTKRIPDTVKQTGGEQ